MADFTLKPRTAFAGLAIPGRYGAGTGEGGISIAARENLSVLQLSVFRGQTDALAKALAGTASLDLPWRRCVGTRPGTCSRIQRLPS